MNIHFPRYDRTASYFHRRDRFDDLAIWKYPTPSRRRRKKEIERAEDIVAIIDVLRENEGSDVSISSDNGDPENKTGSMCNQRVR
jgi:hypothetical protein